ncbi:ABC transporter permease [Ornithinibacillus salinisoli]|uniref:ABC transporter permease n=1 Tax=Ornithinibacillus salinisoli TaxID=1848459 RepID=A0ABW4VY83_9BACI
MIGILLAKCKVFIRNPWTFAIFTAMSIGFAFLIGGTGNMASIQVPVYTDDDAIQNSFIGNEMKEMDAYTFQWMEEEELEERVANGKAEVGVKLSTDTFQVVVGVESPNIEMIEQSIRGIYVEKQQRDQILAALDSDNTDEDTIITELEAAYESPIFSVQTGNFRSDDAVVYDNTFQSLFGFTLFFVIYTIAYNVLPILTEKRDGVWDRVILSPVRKWEMYVANLIYSFLTGYLQIAVIFTVFRYIVGVDFNDRFWMTLVLLIPYVFAIVALSIFLTAVVKNVQQFNAIIPIVSVSMAMIGGAYWPLEIVESKIMIALSKINPLTYGMELMNGIAIYGYPLEELLYPISILILMGVLFMGVGIHLMERRHV